MKRFIVQITTFITMLPVVIPVHVFAECSHPETTAEQKACMYEDFLGLEKKLSASYKSALKSFSVQAEDKQDAENARRKLSASQKAWRVFRNKDCDVYSALYPGNNAGQNVLQCEMDRTKQRIRELEAFN